MKMYFCRKCFIKTIGLMVYDNTTTYLCLCVCVLLFLQYGECPDSVRLGRCVFRAKNESIDQPGRARDSRRNHWPSNVGFSLQRLQRERIVAKGWDIIRDRPCLTKFSLKRVIQLTLLSRHVPPRLWSWVGSHQNWRQRDTDRQIFF